MSLIGKNPNPTPPPIVQDGAPVLRHIAEKVSPSLFGTTELAAIITVMNRALDQETDGVAIAAPQIGIPLRIFIISRKAFLVDDREKRAKKGDPEEKPVTLPPHNVVCINPTITKMSKRRVKVPEGCLSVRWYYGNTMRHLQATIHAYDETGKPFTLGGSGLMAQIFQHETDHLNGILFVDHATEVERLSDEEIREMEKRGAQQK
jgi:peptide deformylase